MEIPKRLLDKWKLNREHGDMSEIHKESKISLITLGNAFKMGRASKETVFAINKFYNEKPLKKKMAEKKLIEELEAE